MTAQESLFASGIGGREQAGWRETATEAAVAFEASTGFITLDYAGPYESAHELSEGLSWSDGRREAANFLRGYFWGNFLSGRHIATLGGLEKIRNEAPCYLVEDLSTEKHQLAYLQLTESIEDVSDDALRRLKEYFHPLLRTGKKGKRPLDLPMRVV